MKILLADDHALIRSGLRNDLRELDEAVVFVEAWDAASLDRMVEEHGDLDLALIDLTMPGMEGGATIASLRRRYPALPLIVLSGVEAPESARIVLKSGAAGFIPKTSMSKVMLHAIRLVLAGGQYLPPHLLRLTEDGEGDSAAGAAPDASIAQRHAATTGALGKLSARQRQVFDLLAKGLSNKEIARALGVTEGTVKTHVATIFDVLDVHNRVSAVTLARGLVEQDQDRNG